ncbi:fimbrial protein [Variovorax robiniae]|uniref:Fimbrial protein n=1 Tax=Variovorax robiniae TaxID=1836199 RepID=A0ABU8X865_9BURK
MTDLRLRSPGRMSGLPRRWLAAVALCLMALGAASSAHAGCSKYSPFNDFPLLFDFGSQIVIDQNTPVGSPIAQVTISGDVLRAQNGGYFGYCDNASNRISYWWLEQHWSRSANNGPVAGVTSPTPGGGMYVMQDSGSGNPYGDGTGSGTVGYTTELISAGAPDQSFTWTTSGTRKNIPPMPTPIVGIPCADAKASTGAAAGYPAYTSCSNGQYLFNWRQLPQFSIRATLYKLAGNPPAAGVQLQNNGGNGFSLFSVMNNESTPPANNTQLFNLVRLQLTQNTRITMTPCGSFGQVDVNMGKVPAGSFPTVGQPAKGDSTRPVQITAQCAKNTAVNWAVVGQADGYDSTGAQGVLKLDSTANPAKGIAVQLLQSNDAPLPLTQPGAVQYKWVGSGSTADASGNLQLNFKARYLRTGTVTPGVANSHATLVIAPK